MLGPLLFIVYTADLADIAEKHGVSLHAFADDTQVYLHDRRTDMTSAAAQLEQCIADVGHWMLANRLKLNTDKTASDRDTAFPGKAVVFQYYNLVPALLQPATTSVY